MGTCRRKLNTNTHLRITSSTPQSRRFDTFKCECGRTLFFDISRSSVPNATDSERHSLDAALLLLPPSVAPWTLERVNRNRMLEQGPSKWHVVPVEHERYRCIPQTSSLHDGAIIERQCGR